MSVLSRYKNKTKFLIKKSGIYKLEIISAFSHKSRKGRECIYFLFCDKKHDLYAYSYVVVATAKGRIREFERKNIIDKFMVLGEIYDLRAMDDEALFWDFSLAENKPKILINKKPAKVYKDLIGKTFLIELLFRKWYDEYGAIFINYDIMEIFHKDTKQTMGEYINNLPSLEFDNER